MKWLILFFLMAGTTLQSAGQAAGTAYAFTTDSRVYLWNDATLQPVTDSSTYYRAERGNIFVIKEKVSYRVGTDVIVGYRISFWKFTNGKQGTTVDPPGVKIVLIKNTNPALSFFISDLDLTTKTTTDFRKPSGFFTLSAVVIPIKLRFKNNQPGGIFDFTQSISLGPIVSKTWNQGGAFGNRSFSILFGVNITNVPVDQTTVPGVITAKTTLFGLSPVVGLNVEIGGINFGALTGLDIVTGEAGRSWAYRKSPWFGFSIGTSLFSTTPATPTQ